MTGEEKKAKQALVGAGKAVVLVLVVAVAFIVGFAVYEWSSGELGGGPIPFLIALLIGALGGYVTFRLILWVLSLAGLSL